MPGWVAKMSRNNTRSGSARRKPVGNEVLNPVLLNETPGQPGSRNKTQAGRHDPAAEPDVSSDGLIDIDTILERQTAHDANDAVKTGIARRRIEMLRESQWLQRQLADSFDS
jgi:hypothetical protein